MRFCPTVALLAIFSAGFGRAPAAELAGRWKAEFDSQIGVQKYVFEFKVAGDRLTGTATFERSLGNGAVELKNIKVSGDDVSFVEPFVFDGNEIPISYAGKLTESEMKLTRQVGEFATEQVVAKRVPPPAPGPPPAK